MDGWDFGSEVFPLQLLIWNDNIKRARSSLHHYLLCTVAYWDEEEDYFHFGRKLVEIQVYLHSMYLESTLRILLAYSPTKLNALGASSLCQILL